MEFSVFKINWLGVFIATFVYFLLGGLWFSQFVFGKQWDRALGFDRPSTWKETPIYFMGPFLGCLITSIAIAIVSRLANVSSSQEAIILGIVTGIGFASTVSFTDAITPIMRKPLLYGVITGAYHTIGFVLVSMIVY